MSYDEGFGTADGTEGTEVSGFGTELKPPELTGGAAARGEGAGGATAPAGVEGRVKPPDDAGGALGRGAENPPDDGRLLELLLDDDDETLLVPAQAVPSIISTAASGSTERANDFLLISCLVAFMRLPVARVSISGMAAPRRRP